MKQAKKIFTRMCLNNWGGISHQIITFHEYVNLFSGKSGSGKSTVMDAIQVILYGSLASAFLNKAADDAKNRRSVYSYLRGEQKDGTANRAGRDFCSTIVLEIEDTGTHRHVCVGMAFELRKNDGEIKKYLYFSHEGKMPENFYLTEEGFPYDQKQIRQLVEERKLKIPCQGIDCNRIYTSREAYLNMLYDVILGYIDGNRFQVMEKSAIALKMTNGTGQFIRDYMFPKSTGDVIEKLSDQLGAYRDIKEKIEDVEHRIQLLSEIKQISDKKIRCQADIEKAEQIIRCVDITELEGKIAAWEDATTELAGRMYSYESERKELEEYRNQIEEELIRVTADLKASDLGALESRLLERKKRYDMLKEDERLWNQVTEGLKHWEEAPVITDYVSNTLLQKIEAFCEGDVTEETCLALKKRIAEEKEIIEKEQDEYAQLRRNAKREYSELEQLTEEMRQNRKPYPKTLQEARTALARRLSEKYGKNVTVSVFADLFDVTDPEWKNAIEGRMGKLKFSLITEPLYATDAAGIFRKMKEYEDVELINTAALEQMEPEVEEGSLYEAVTTEYPYVDQCLKRYLGRVIKCSSMEELAQVRDGVTSDCYAYSGFIFRHLKKKDYDRYACIGSRVSKSKLKEYEEQLKKAKDSWQEYEKMEQGLKAVHQLEALNMENSYLIRLSEAGKQTEQEEKELDALQEEITALQQGSLREINAKREELKQKQKMVQQKLDENVRQSMELLDKKSHLEGEMAARKEELKAKQAGSHITQEQKEETAELLKMRSVQSVRRQKFAEADKLRQEETEKTEQLQTARSRFNREYPSLGFHDMASSNACYEELLEEYRREYEPKYQQEFETQCGQIYRSLRENVIATIHGDINAAKRHTQEINRMLRQTNFADSTYQIKIEPARNENRQFYEMLTAPELDSKNLSSDKIEGQMSLGEDQFYAKYEKLIELLTDKFMPPKSGEEGQREKHQKQMEQYADYRNYLSFSMYEQVTDADGNVIRENYVDEMAGRDSGGEGQNPKYVALLAGFAMLYMQQTNLESKIRLVLLDEAFSKMDQERSAVCLNYARNLELQMIVCVPDERLQSLIRNVDSVYGFRRYQNQISMMHISKGSYLTLMEGEQSEETERVEAENAEI